MNPSTLCKMRATLRLRGMRSTEPSTSSRCAQIAQAVGLEQKPASERAKDAASEMGSAARQGASEAKDSARDAAGRAAGAVEDAAHSAKERAQS